MKTIVIKQLVASLGVGLLAAVGIFGQQVNLATQTKGLLPAANGGATGAVNAQTGTTYTYLTGDRGKLVTHSNAAAIAAALPQANTTTFRAGWFVDIQDIGAGTLTITPTTSTINGVATLVLTTGQGAHIVSDGTNYSAQLGKGGASLGSLTGVIKASSGTPAVVSGSASDCVFVNGTSGTCGVPVAGTGILVVGSTVSVDPSAINTAAGTNTNTGPRIDNSAVGQTAPARVNAAAPTSCVLGDIWIDTSQTAAGQTKVCTTAGTPGTFTAQGTVVKVPIVAAHSVNPGSPADSTTYFWAPTGFIATACASYGNLEGMVVPVTGTVTDLFVSVHNQGTLGTGESVTYTLLKNCVATALTTTGTTNAESPAIVSDSAHTAAITKGDRLQLQIVTPAWATNPTNISFSWSVSIQE